MHPEIKKFWEGAGYKVVQSSELNWWASKWEDVLLHDMQIAELLPSGEYFYRWPRGERRSEQEMLRIVRLKAFL